MGKLRVDKLQALLKQEISEIIFHGLKDPRIGFVTVTQVECTGDLREAKVYVSVMGNDSDINNTLKGLESSLGFIRREVGKKISIRFTPEINFVLDKSLDYSDHIHKLLLSIDDK